MSLVERNAIRERLHNPPNAVPDTGINLKRREIVSEPAPKTYTPNQLEREIFRLDRDIKQWRGKLDAAKRRRAELLGQDASPFRVSIEAIQDIVCIYFERRISINDLLSARRTKDLFYPRHIAMYLAKELTLRSMPEIGRRFGGKDHTTVLHAWRKIRALRETNLALNETIESITALCACATKPEDAPCNSPQTSNG